LATTNYNSTQVGSSQLETSGNKSLPTAAYGDSVT